MPHYSQLESIHVVKHTDPALPDYYIRANWSDPTSQICVANTDYPDDWSGTEHQVATFGGVESVAKLISTPEAVASVDLLRIVDRDDNRYGRDGKPLADGDSVS
jgi:hypothetical protein